MIGWLIALWGKEPVVLTGIVDAAIVLAVSLGAHLDPAVGTAVDGLIVAIGVLIARSQVSSPATVANLVDRIPKIPPPLTPTPTDPTPAG